MEENIPTTSISSTTLRVGSVVVIVLALGGIVFWMMKKTESNSMPGANPATNDASVVGVSSTVEVISDEEQEANFQASLSALIQGVQGKQGDRAEVMSYVEEQMFQIRVPKNRTDAYMKVFLAFDNLKQQTSQSLEETKEEVMRQLQTLQ